MNNKVKKCIVTFMLAIAIVAGTVNVAYAASFGTRKNGASSKEVLQVKYDGAAWNYAKSGYKNASFKYTRGGRTLLSRTAKSGKVTGSVWDDLVNWSGSATTKFSWSHTK